jgi:CubicO group peptidase (beta-lactamase class C family)
MTFSAFSITVRLSLSAMLLCLALSAPTTARDRRSDPIHASLTRFHDEGNFNGVALVARGNKVLHEAAYGFRDAAGSAPLRTDDLFNIGSIAKEFSAVALMLLRDQGSLSIDAPVARVITDLPAWSEKITARHLLDYTSGLPDLRWRAIKNDRDAYADLQKVTALAFDPGTQFNYGYNNVMLRQFIVEKLAGVSFSEFIERRIFKPCRMRDAALDPAPDAPKLARAFNRDRKPDDTFMPISGVVFATARDLLRWRECLHGRRVISRQSLVLLGHSFNPQNGALGKAVWDGERLVEHRHLGQSRNFEALLFADLARGITVVLLSNSKHENLEEILAAVVPLAATAR